jgi:exosortase A-associated hydrolase 2
MTALRVQIEPFFLDGPNGPLFCIHTVPERPRGAVLYLPPFAEEMHKSRRMAALHARALAARGYAVLQPDLSGCGDSAGDFGDALWSGWLEDATRAQDWLVAAHGHPVVLWGLRTGALLAADLAQRRPAARLLLWQPVVDGSVFLNQFLRIRLASEMLSDGQAKNGNRRLLEALEAGESIEVGGYLLAPAMARELGALRLAGMAPTCPVSWFEVGGSTGVSPASRRVVDAWLDRGAIVDTEIIEGDPFWSTPEISVCTPLIDATLACLDHEHIALV